MANNRLLHRLGIELPIIQAPMAGCNGSALAVAVSEAGGLGSLPCATISLSDMRQELEIITQQTKRPYNVNFFCHRNPTPDPTREAHWRDRLGTHLNDYGIDQSTLPSGAARTPFSEQHLDLLRAFKPRVVSFHFGLPDSASIAAIKQWGGVVLASATTVAEARWLEQHGADAVIAQGAEAGGHRGMFLYADLLQDAARQPGTMALVPQVVDAVQIPVIAAGGIGDGRGIAAARLLGASAVQLGTVYLLTPEAKTAPLHRQALKTANDGDTALTNLFTGRPARGILNGVMKELGPLNPIAPEFPLAANTMNALRAKAEARGEDRFTSLWSGQAPGFARAEPAGELTRQLAASATDRMRVAAADWA